jgi:hypothetical protein
VHFSYRTFVSNVSEIKILFVSRVAIFDFVSDKKYENGNGFDFYKSFLTVFILNHLRTLTSVAWSLLCHVVTCSQDARQCFHFYRNLWQYSGSGIRA